MFHALAALAVSIPLIFLNIMPTLGHGEINGPQCPPPVNDAYELWVGQTLTVDAPGVLANDPVLPIREARYYSGPTHGTLTLNKDGSFTYTPETGFIGVDTFKYKVYDGSYTSTTATVTLTVKDYFRVYFPVVGNSLGDGSITGE